jgi:hypothetical protein
VQTIRHFVKSICWQHCYSKNAAVTVYLRAHLRHRKERNKWALCNGSASGQVLWREVKPDPRLAEHSWIRLDWLMCQDLQSTSAHSGWRSVSTGWKHQQDLTYHSPKFVIRMCDARYDSPSGLTSRSGLKIECVPPRTVFETPSPIFEHLKYLHLLRTPNHVSCCRRHYHYHCNNNNEYFI